MDRGIDHLVLCVKDMGQARARYDAMGFRLTPRAEHPFGTENSLAQLDGVFIELLAEGEPQKIPEHGGKQFSFAAFNRDFLKKREGFSMLVLRGQDARADAAEFRDKGLSDFEPFDFSRTAKLPGGEEAQVGFSLAFIAPPEMPDAAFFTCQQHAPEHFWKPEYQSHPNSAKRIAEVVMVAEAPAEWAGFLGKIFGDDAVTKARDETAAESGNGRITILTAEGFKARFDTASPAPGDTPRLVAYVVEVENLDHARAALEDGALKFARRDGALQLGTSAAFGVVIEFIEASGQEAL